MTFLRLIYMNLSQLRELVDPLVAQPKEQDELLGGLNLQLGDSNESNPIGLGHWSVGLQAWVQSCKIRGELRLLPAQHFIIFTGCLWTSTQAVHQQPQQNNTTTQ